MPVLQNLKIIANVLKVIIVYRGESFKIIRCFQK